MSVFTLRIPDEKLCGYGGGLKAGVNDVPLPIGIEVG